MIDIFILKLAEPDQRFFVISWILIVVISIVIHELAHGWAAVRLGDDTPIRLGRMTGNPLVHMGPFSLVALVVFGIAWGQMPIDPTRLRGRYAEAQVAFAGPGSNLVLAVVCLVTLGLLMRHDPQPDGQAMRNLHQFLFAAGSANLLLAAFNLCPVPPLDGSHILANFHHGYARLVGDPSKQGVFLLGFFFVFALFGQAWDWAYRIAAAVTGLIVSVGT